MGREIRLGLSVVSPIFRGSILLPDNPNWQMTVFLLLALAVMGFVMKLVALLLPAKREIERRAVSWVLFSPNSVLRARRATGAGPVALRILLLFAAVLLSYWVYWQLVRGFQIHGILLSYLAVPLLLLIGESLVAIMNLFLPPCGCLLPALHCRPWAARSIADFWGNRWNLWFSDWSRYFIFGRLRRRAEQCSANCWPWLARSDAPRSDHSTFTKWRLVRVV